MLETLKARKEALEAQGKKGFTLMEMLIVIAIIAILIAIAIPIFTAQLERAGESTDGANIRSEYAEFMADYITNDVSSGKYKVTLQQGQDGWQNSDIASGLDALKTSDSKGLSVNLDNLNNVKAHGEAEWVSTDASTVTLSFTS